MSGNVAVVEVAAEHLVEQRLAVAQRQLAETQVRLPRRQEHRREEPLARGHGAAECH